MKLADLIKLPGVIIATVVAVVAIAATITKYVTIPETFDAHVAESNAHAAASAVVHDSLFDGAEDSHEHLQTLERLSVALYEERAVEQCMENEYPMLARQKLLPKCDSLGIHRTPNDVPPQ